MSNDGKVTEARVAVQALTDQGLYVQAVDRGLAAMEAYGAAFPLLNAVGHALFRAGEHARAIDFLQRALKLQPGHYYSHLDLARSLEAIGETVAALRHYWLACEVCPALAHQALQFGVLLLPQCQGTPEAEALNHFISSGESPQSENARKLLRAATREASLTELRESLSGLPTGEGKTLELRDLCSVKDWMNAQSLQSAYHELGEPEPLPYASIGADGINHIERYVDSTIPYVAALPEVTIVGDSSLIFDAQRRAISDVLTHPLYGRFASLVYDKSVNAQYETTVLVDLPPVAHHMAEGMMVSGCLAYAFGHWHAEFLPKLLCYEQIPGFRNIPLIVDAEMPQSHYDFLRAVVDNELYILPRGERLLVEKLWVAPNTTFRPNDFLPNHNIPVEQQGGLSPRALTYLRERVLKTAQGVSPREHEERRRVYISRRKTKGRFLLNEAEVSRILSAAGFEIVYPEDMSFMEQVFLYRSAKQIVAPSGSALNNIIFCDPDVQVLVIQSDSYDWGMGLGPLMQLGYTLNFIQCAQEVGAPSKHGNFTVDIAEFEAAVRAQTGIKGAFAANESTGASLLRNSVKPSGSRSKIFCIGRNKTGTTSIAEVLTALGYKVGDQAAAELLMDDWGQRDFHRIVEYCRTADAFQDVPFSLDYTYCVLDHAFPYSKFILTVRNSGDEWYESLTRFHSKAFCNGSRVPTADDLKSVNYRAPGWLWKAHTMIYGNDESNVYGREKYIRHYEDHNARVIEYFKYRSDDLLVLNLADLNAMESLCRFLGVEANGMVMPHSNAS